MREITIKAYKIGELSGKARTNAIEFGCQMVDSMFDADEFKDSLAEHAKEKFGVVTERLNYSLNNCQGDGVAFYGNLELEELAKKDEIVRKSLEKANEMDVTLTVTVEDTNGRYSHWNSMCATAEHDGGYRYSERFQDCEEKGFVEMERTADNLVEELGKYINELLKTASRDTEREGYKWLEVSKEESRVIELLEANECEFDENGNKITE